MDSHMNLQKLPAANTLIGAFAAGCAAGPTTRPTTENVQRDAAADGNAAPAATTTAAGTRSRAEVRAEAVDATKHEESTLSESLDYLEKCSGSWLRR